MVDVGIILDHYRPLIAIKTIKTHHLQVPFSPFFFYKKRIGAQPFAGKPNWRPPSPIKSRNHRGRAESSKGVELFFFGKMGMFQNVYIPKWNGWIGWIWVWWGYGISSKKHSLSFFFAWENSPIQWSTKWSLKPNFPYRMVELVFFVEWGHKYTLEIQTGIKKWDTGWWFQTFFVLITICGRFPCWLIFFKGVETTN